MKKIITKIDISYLEDCKRIQKIFTDRGYDITIMQAEFLWEKYSAEMCAGWLCLLSSDDQIFKSVQGYWREENED